MIDECARGSTDRESLGRKAGGRGRLVNVPALVTAVNVVDLMTLFPPDAHHTA